MIIADPEISHEKIKLRHLSTQKFSVRNRIVDIHIHFRASVNPPAKNMLKMVSVLDFHFITISFLKIYTLHYNKHHINIIFSVGINEQLKTPKDGRGDVEFLYMIHQLVVTSMTLDHVDKIYLYQHIKFHGILKYNSKSFLSSLTIITLECCTLIQSISCSFFTSLGCMQSDLGIRRKKTLRMALRRR